jgi:hypothetical protein
MNITTDLSLFLTGVSSVYVNPDSFVTSINDDTQVSSNILVLGDALMGNPLFPIVKDGLSLVRLFGYDSRSYYLSVTNTDIIKSKTVGIYKGITSYKDFDTKKTTDGEIEILLTMTPTEQVDISVEYSKDLNTLSVSVIQDSSIIYAVKGTPEDITNLCDRKLMQIRVTRKTTDSIFDKDFSLANSFVNLTSDLGSYDKDTILNIIGFTAWRCAYSATNGSVDKDVISILDEVSKKYMLQLHVDVPFYDIDEAVKFIDSLALDCEHVFILDRRDEPKGYSLDLVAKKIKRDYSVVGSRIKQKAIYSIMGVSHPIAGVEDESGLYFSDEELIIMARNKIVYITLDRGYAIYGDTFGDENDIDLYIDKQLANIASNHLGKNPIIARNDIEKEATRFINDCDQAGFFKEKEDLTVIDEDGKLCILFKSKKITPYRRGEVRSGEL